MPKSLTEEVIQRLTIDAVMGFLGQAESFEASLRPGCALSLSNEPVADLNSLTAGRGAAPRPDPAASPRARTALN